MSFYENQHFISDKISHSSDFMTSYPIDSVFFKGITSSIGLIFSTNYLNKPPSPKNGANIH